MQWRAVFSITHFSARVAYLYSNFENVINGTRTEMIVLVDVLPVPSRILKAFNVCVDHMNTRL
jgi:hypothetical protein